MARSSKIKEIITDLFSTKPDLEGKNNFKPWLRDPYQFQSLFTRVSAMLRISIALNIALCLVIVVLGTTISVLLPLKDTEFVVVKIIDGKEKMITIEPTTDRADSFDLVVEKLALEYPKLLLEIDPISQNQRFSKAWIFTSSGFHDEFYKTRIANGAIQEAMDDGINRSIISESAEEIERLEDGTRKIAVDIIQIDERKGKEIERKKLRVYLSIAVKKHLVTEKDKLNNPYGLFVTGMSIKEKETK